VPERASCGVVPLLITSRGNGVSDVLVVFLPDVRHVQIHSLSVTVSPLPKAEEITWTVRRGIETANEFGRPIPEPRGRLMFA